MLFMVCMYVMYSYVWYDRSIFGLNFANDDRFCARDRSNVRSIETTTYVIQSNTIHILYYNCTIIVL